MMTPYEQGYLSGLEKVAISGNMARRALARKLQRLLTSPQSTQEVGEAIARALEQHPRTIGKAIPPGNVGDVRLLAGIKALPSQIRKAVKNPTKKPKGLLFSPSELRSEILNEPTFKELITRGGPPPEYIAKKPNWKF